MVSCSAMVSIAKEKPSWLSSWVAVVADQVGRLLDVAEGLQPVLADLHAHQRGQLVRPLADQVGCAAQQRHALLPWRRRPRAGGPTGSRDGIATSAGVAECTRHSTMEVSTGLRTSKVWPVVRLCPST